MVVKSVDCNIGREINTVQEELTLLYVGNSWS